MKKGCKKFKFSIDLLRQAKKKRGNSFLKLNFTALTNEKAWQRLQKIHQNIKTKIKYLKIFYNKYVGILKVAQFQRKIILK